jgi:sugar lactone lactonase YvrE
MRIIGNDPSVPRQTQEVASGTLTNGKPVIVNANGTVSDITSSSATESLGTQASFASNSYGEINVGYDSNASKFVIVYRNSSSRGAARVATINTSDNTVSYGTETEFANHSVSDCGIAFDSVNNKIVISYRKMDGTYYGAAIVGTISGTSISFGTAVNYVSNNVSSLQNGIAYDSSNQRIVIAYRDNTNTRGQAIVGTVSGTSISFGSAVNFNNQQVSYPSVSYNSEQNKVLICYRFQTGNTGLGRVGTVSGTSISFGDNATFLSTEATYIDLTYSSSLDKHILTYQDANDSNKGKVRTATISGTTVSFGTAVEFEDGYADYNSIAYDGTAEKFVIHFRDPSDSGKPKYVTGSVSGTDVTVSSPTNVDTTSNVGYTTVAVNGSGQALLAWQDGSSGTSSGKSTPFQIGYNNTNLTSENYIGIARSGAASGAGATIDTQGAIADIPTTNYNLDLASFSDKSFNTQTNHNDIFIKPDGTKIYYIVDGGSAFQRTLSTAFDISTAGSATSFDGTSQDNDPRGITFKPDGTKMYLLGTQNNKVYQYSLSSAFDVTSASYDSKSISAAVGYVYGSEFKSDGTKMYLTESSSGTYYITEYTLSTPWDVSTASYTSNSFNVSSQSNALTGIFLRSDGTQIFGASQNDRKILQYNFGTAFDVSTLSYSNTSFDTSTQVGGSSSIKAVAFNPDGDKMYVGGVFATDTIYQYSTTSAFTPAQSYFVQTDGTLSTTAGDPSVFAGTAVSATKLIVKG